jgi:hypothetical protein
MKKLPVLLALAALPAVLPLLSGCDQQAGWVAISPIFYLFNQDGSSNDTTTDPVGADIAGEWAGYYENDETGESEAITATVGQDGDAVTIITSKIGVAHQLSGAISTDASLYMTDAYDGQTWTSQRAATHNSLELGDYTYTPEGGDAPEPPLQFIQLYR